MSITVVVRRHAREGQEEALITAIAAALARCHSGASTRGQVFQGLDDPRAVLYLARWANRREYLSRNRGSARRLDRLCDERPRRAFCQELDLFEASTAQVEVNSCLVIEAPLAATAALITYLFERSGPALFAAPGVALRAVYQDLDVPSRLFTMVGWRSTEDQEAARRLLEPRLDPPLRELGATIEHFLSRTRVEIEPRRG